MVKIAEARAGAEFLTVVWNDGRHSRFHWLWLRDNCQCKACRHEYAAERVFDLLSVPIDIVPDDVELVSDRAVRIRWPAGRHESIFDAAWLDAYRPERRAEIDRVIAREPWLGGQRSALRAMSFESVMTSDAAVATWCEGLLRHGVVLIEGVPTTPGTVAEVARRIGPVWTHAVSVFDIAVDARPESSAYTALMLPPHTDLPSRLSAPAYQLLHCLHHPPPGSESTLVDGLSLVTLLEREDPESLEILKTVDVEFRFSHTACDYRWRGKILTCDPDGSLRAIRFNPFLQSPLDVPPDDMRRVYRAIRALLALANRPAVQLRFTLRTGDLVSFDNHRVLHGRARVEVSLGRRHLQSCYLDADEVASRRRMFGSRGIQRSWSAP